MVSREVRKILITDDKPEVLESTQRVLEGQGYDVRVAKSAKEALGRLQKESVNALITDLDMPDMDGLGLTREVLKQSPNLPVLILTAYGSVDTAVEAMRCGAVDFLTKPIAPEELVVRLGRRLDEYDVRADYSRLKADVRKQGRYGEIIGGNREMLRIFEIIERVAERPAKVLIQGEPGTGKECIARAIHHRRLEKQVAEELEGSERERFIELAEVKQPYMAVNCGAFARHLLESQLFGHKKGAFTDAVADHEGVFVAARSGTLFLDEITEIPLDLQVKLLRAIEEREVTPIGTNESIRTYANLVTATNQDIGKLVEENRFRSDLFFRINVVNITVPPLRDRVDDIPLLVQYFMRRIASEFNVAPREIESRVMEAFQSYHWPGNVRELKNYIERAFAIGRNERKITLDDIPPHVISGEEERQPSNGDRVFPTLAEIEREHIRKAIQISRGVKTKAARFLDIDRNRLYRLMTKHRIEED